MSSYLLDTTLGLVCSPSVMMGEPVSSKREMVSQRADSSAVLSCSTEILPAVWAPNAASKSAGRGMLPISSVGIGMTVFRGSLICVRNAAARKAKLRSHCVSEWVNLTCDGEMAAILQKD
jgi:hypothetical protein